MDKNNHFNKRNVVIRKNDDNSLDCELTRVDEVTAAGNYISPAAAFAIVHRHRGCEHFGELGQRQLLEGDGSFVSNSEKMDRYNKIDMDNVSHTISDISVETDSEGVMMLVGKIRPAGAHAPELVQVMEGNAYLAMRGFGTTQKAPDGSVINNVIDVITWDLCMYPESQPKN